ncbi:hypothetical protein LY78DRAFT_47069 [Colletotrichum sublineola]|nr:hypothetical protein LY78DRAFT_47069 [Colletotrichum sublineola]
MSLYLRNPISRSNPARLVFIQARAVGRSHRSRAQMKGVVCVTYRLPSAHLARMQFIISSLAPSTTCVVLARCPLLLPRQRSTPAATEHQVPTPNPQRLLYSPQPLIALKP